MTKIIIAGAGFGGLNLALGLEKKFRHQKDVSITLVDRYDYHLYSPNLYEVATAEEEFTGISQLKKSIALPFRKLLKNKRVNFVQGEVGFIDQARRKIKAGIRELDYDFLVLAMGSQTEYFGISGAEQYALPLKSLKDAFRIRNALEFAVEGRKNDAVKQYVRFIVVGGGCGGVGLSAEMAKLANILAWKNSYPREKIEVMIVEAANQLIPGLDEKAGLDILYRLKNLGVNIKLLSPAVKVERHFITLLSGERILYDALVWVAGARGRDYAGLNCERSFRGKVETDEFLRVKGQANIFVLGDAAGVLAPDKSSVSANAWAAVAEAEYLAKALPLLMQNKKPEAFMPGKNSLIVPVGGKWALLKTDKFYFKGYFPYLLRLYIIARYFARLIGWRKAIKYTLFEAELYGRND